LIAYRVPATKQWASLVVGEVLPSSFTYLFCYALAAIRLLRNWRGAGTVGNVSLLLTYNSEAVHRS
jgi:hypothetical protein